MKIITIRTESTRIEKIINKEINETEDNTIDHAHKTTIR